MLRRAAIPVLTLLLGATVGVGAAWAGSGSSDEAERVLESIHGRGAITPAVEDQIGAAFRVWGEDRYETAVAVSQIWDPEDALIVYLATGTNFPDALAVGASTVAGPLLLVQPNVLPPVTQDEIQRLRPCVIIAVGGPAAMSDAVIEQAQASADPAQEKCPPSG